jgi:hypothetical protein
MAKLLQLALCNANGLTQHTEEAKTFISLHNIVVMLNLQTCLNKYIPKTTLNSMVWVRERTLPTEWPPLVGEVIANFLGVEGATWLAWQIPTAVFSVL